MRVEKNQNLLIQKKLKVAPITWLNDGGLINNRKHYGHRLVYIFLFFFDLHVTELQDFTFSQKPLRLKKKGLILLCRREKKIWEDNSGRDEFEMMNSLLCGNLVFLRVIWDLIAPHLPLLIAVSHLSRSSSDNANHPLMGWELWSPDLPPLVTSSLD